MEKGYIQRPILVWISVIMVSASIPFGMSLAGPENAKMMTGGIFDSTDDGTFVSREDRARAELDRKEEKWRELIEEERGTNDDFEERWMKGGLEDLGKMAEMLKEREEIKRIEDKKRSSEFDDRQSAERETIEKLAEAKESLLPGMKDLIQKNFSFDECEERMSAGRDLSESTVKEIVKRRSEKVCGEGESHRSYLTEAIDRLERVEDMGEFHHKFGESFRDFEKSSMMFEQFVRSEMRRLDQMIREEIERLEIERSRIKNLFSDDGELDCDRVAGSSVFGYRDGKYEFIGSISSPADRNSIANELGAGNKYVSSSIFNEFGRYGGKDGEYSAFDPAASEPPVLVDRDNRLVGHLTLNDVKGPRIDPYRAYHCAKGSFRSSISSHEGATLHRWIDGPGGL